MYHLSGQYAAAVATMAEVVKSNPSLFPAQLILGIDLVRLKRSSEAVAHLEAATRLSPRNREARLGLAASTYGLGICDERIAEEASRKLKSYTH